MLHRPLLLPTVGFLVGIVLAEIGTVPVSVAGCVAGFFLLGHAGALVWLPASPRSGRWLTLSSTAAALALGLFAQLLERSCDSPASLRRSTPSIPILGSLRGEIAETPTLRLIERHGQLAASTVVRIQASAWRPENGSWQPATGGALLTLRGPLPAGASRGSSLEAFGTLRLPEAPEAPGLFDYAAFLRFQNIHRVFRVESTNDLRIAPLPGGPPWSEKFLPWAHATLSRGVPDDEATRLLRAMTLGWKTPLSGEVDDVFMRAGTMHVFAISGLHIALLMAMVIQLFRAVRLPRLAAGALALPLTWAYVAATGWQASAVRSAIMASVVLVGTSLQRPSDLLNSLAGAAALILVNEPGQLFQSGFQLSFGAVAGLALLVPPIEHHFLRWIQFDPWIPDALRPRWQQWLAAPLRALAMNLAVGAAALLASLPLTVHHFNLVSPVSLPANLLVVPLSSLALAATTASLAVAPLAPWLSEIFNASGWLWMRGMMDLSRWFATWPGGWWSVPAPAWPWWLGWYGGLALGWYHASPAPQAATAPARTPRWLHWSTVAVAIWAGAAGWTWWRFRHTPRLFVFRNEPALVTQTIDGTTLFDGGRAGAGRRLILPFLRAHGVNRLDVHHISQGIQRFCGLAPELLNDLPPSAVWVPALGASRQPALRRYLTNLTERHIPIHVLQGRSGFAGWTLLAPLAGPATRSTRATDFAPVLLGEFSGVRVLWLGGISAQVAAELLTQTNELRAEVLITVATAGINPLPPELLAAVKPRLVVVQTALFPTAARITPEIRARLHAAPCPVLLTDESGGVSLAFNAGQVQWKTYGAPERREVPPPSFRAPVPDPPNLPRLEGSEPEPEPVRGD